MAVIDILKSQKSLLYSLLYGTLVGIQSNIAKELILTFKASYITFIRCTSLILLVPLVEWEETYNCSAIDLILYIASILATFIPFATMIYSFEFIGVGDSNAIEFGTALIMTGVIGHFVLNERVTRSYSMLLLVNCGGVVMVVRPKFLFGMRENEESPVREIGAMFAFLGSIFLALWPVIIRKINSRQTLHCFAINSLLGLFGMVLAGVWCAIESSWTMPTTWLSVILIVVYGFTNILQMVVAIKLLEIAVATDYAVSTTLSTVISYILQITLFGEKVIWTAILGAVIVITCVFVSTSWEYLGSKVHRCCNPEDDDVPFDPEEIRMLTDDETE